jgi:hypothetical protein
MHCAAQVFADRGIGLGDVLEGTADGLADGDACAFPAVGKLTGPSAKLGGGGEFCGDPVAFGAGPVGALRLALGLQSVDFFVQLGQA